VTTKPRPAKSETVDLLRGYFSAECQKGKRRYLCDHLRLRFDRTVPYLTLPTPFIGQRQPPNHVLPATTSTPSRSAEALLRQLQDQIKILDGFFDSFLSTKFIANQHPASFAGCTSHRQQLSLVEFKLDYNLLFLDSQRQSFLLHHYLLPLGVVFCS
jgi:hypothetical protein